MKNERLLFAFGNISDDIIEEVAATAQSNSTAEQMRSRRRVRSKRRIIICVAAILVLLLATTALAISLGWHIKLIEYFNPSEEQMQTLDGAVNMPEATVTQNGVTITVKQTLADAFGVYVLYEMTVPDDIELNDDIGWTLEILNVPTVKTDEYITAGSGGSEILEQTGNKRTVLYHLDTTAAFENGDIKLTLRDLIRYKRNDETGSMEITPVVKGEWELEWNFTFVDTSKTIDLNRPLSINGSDNIITKIVIAPMSFCAFVKGDDIVGSARPVINFKDGSQLTYDDLGYGNKSFGYYLIDEANMIYSNQLYYRFEKIIDLNDVASIQISDVVIPIE